LRLLQDAQAQFADFLTAFEGISRNALASVLRHLPQVSAPFDPLPDYALLVEVSSSAEASEHFDLDKLFMAWLERHFDDAIVDAVVDKPETLWRLRHAISDSVKQEGKIVAFDISVSRSRMPAFRAEALALVERDFAGAEVFDFGHWGDGGVHFNLAIAAAAQPQFPAERIEALRTALYDLVAKLTKAVSVPSMASVPSTSITTSATRSPSNALAGRVQAVFDPHCLLGNTRFT
jgi:FAD/FMN-containing dehydrogenase